MHRLIYDGALQKRFLFLRMRVGRQRFPSAQRTLGNVGSGQLSARHTMALCKRGTDV